jgi:type II secretion system protein I
MKLKLQHKKKSHLSSRAGEREGALEFPPGFGVRQSSGAFPTIAASKAPEDWRTPGRYRAAGHRGAAFTLLEVMIALGIFFMCIFAILEVVATNLRAARKLQDQPVDISLLVADAYQNTKIEEGSDSGDFADLFPGYKWESQTNVMATNGLFKVEFMVTHPGGNEHSEQHMTVLLWRPDSPQKAP